MDAKQITLTPLERAVDIMGGQTALAKAIGGTVKQAHVWNWLNGSRGRVPAEYCRAIETATKGLVTCQQLRPDVFGREAA